MKIQKMFIDGFGHFHKYTIKDLSPNLTIIKGPNEAGKSTLLAFIRRMLFGKPPGRSYNPYEPLNGGELGGRLSVETDAGESYDIERIGRLDSYSILDQKGSPLKKPVDSIIGSADQYFYDNVYAFGLEELYKFETLSNESIEKYLTGAGVGVKNCSIPDLHRSIKDETEALYKGGARSKPKIMKNIKDIAEIDKNIRICSRTQTEYDDNKQMQRYESQQLKDAKSRKTEILRDIASSENIQNTWDEWAEYKECTDRLAELPAIEKFPDNGIHDLDKFIEHIQEHEETKEGKEHELRNLLIDIKDTKINASILKSKDKIRALERGLEKYLADVSSRNNLSDENTEREGQYKRNLAAINPEWTDDTLISFNYSPEAQSRVREFKKNFSQYEEEERGLSRDLNLQEKERDSLLPRLQLVKDALNAMGDVPSADAIRTQKQAVDELYTDIPTLEHKKVELESIKKEEAAANERLKENRAFIGGEAPVWPAGLIIAAGLLSLGLGIINDSLAIGGVLFIAFGFIALIYYHAVKKQEDDRFGLPTHISPDTETKLIEWADIRRDKQKEISNLEARLADTAKVCGFATLPSAANISSKRSELEHLSTEITTKSNKESEKEKLDNEISSINTQIDEMTAKLGQTREKLSNLESEWRDWLRSSSLPDSMDPEIVLGIFPKIEHLSDEYYSLRKNANDLVDLTDAVQQYEDKMHSVLVHCQLPSSGTVEVDVENVVSSLDSNLEMETSLNTMNSNCKKLEGEIASLSEKIEALEGKKSQLLSEGSSGDEDQFRENATIWEEREALAKTIETNRKKILRAAGKDTSFDDYITILEKTDDIELRENIDRLKEELGEVEKEIDSKNTSLGQISEVISRLESEDESAFLESQRLLLLEDLHENSREWVKRVIASHILNKAVERYEKERQPAVIQEATDIFTDISDGRYTRIIKPLESNGFIVEEVTGNRKTVGQLSRGTAEQLYLALRFGYITEFGKHDVGLPVVFDDVLVNFDPMRKENTCRAIAELAENNQIMYFTCHPETVALLKESRPDAVVIELES